MSITLDQAVKNYTKPNLSTLILGIGILVLDFVTKFLTSHYITRLDQVAYWYPYGGIGVFRNFIGIEFSINYLTNRGAAWGVFGDYQFLLILVRIALIGGLIVYTLLYNRHSSWQIPLILLIAGAIGNVIDFFLYGHVVDMFHFILWGYDFPVFNIADAAISIGIGSLLILSWIRP